MAQVAKNQNRKHKQYCNKVSLHQKKRRKRKEGKKRKETAALKAKDEA